MEEKMSIQKYFIEFNDLIKMDYDMNSELCDKRDIIIKKLRNSDEIPSFNSFNQGSYAMHTGVEPYDKEYDIDVGIRFLVNKSDWDSFELKRKVCKILENHTDYGAEIKEPCVTVTYKKNGEKAYHVDLPIYAYEDKGDASSQLYLSRGDQNSNATDKIWEPADPIKLTELIMEKFDDSDERAQFRRIIRYLKRWKNIKFDGAGNSEPSGIGITLLAYNYFEPKNNDYLEGFKADDLEALLVFANSIVSKFYHVGVTESGRKLYRIAANLPPILRCQSKDVFEAMTDIQMTNFKDHLEKLSNGLQTVKDEPDIVEQCALLSKLFGADFPVIDKETASKQQANYIPSSSSSGSSN